MGLNPWFAREYISILTGGGTAHHKKPVNMVMQLPDGTLVSNGSNNMAVFVPHFEYVFRNHRPVDFNSILDLIPQQEQLMEIDHPITFSDIDKAITTSSSQAWLRGSMVCHLKCKRPSGRAHANADSPLHWPILWRWHQRLRWMALEPMCSCSKNGDTADPDKWRGAVLMDVCGKNFSSDMNDRPFRLLELHGTWFQFGGTPEVGCRDGLFTLKALHNPQRNHDLGSYVGFVDLIIYSNLTSQLSTLHNMMMVLQFANFWLSTILLLTTDERIPRNIISVIEHHDPISNHHSHATTSSSIVTVVYSPLFCEWQIFD